MSNKYCGTCDHFNYNLSCGTCRRFPPQSVYRGYMGGEPVFLFPKVNRTDVCGEWKPNAEIRARQAAEIEEAIKEAFN